MSSNFKSLEIFGCWLDEISNLKTSTLRLIEKIICRLINSKIVVVNFVIVSANLNQSTVSVEFSHLTYKMEVEEMTPTERKGNALTL